MLSPADEGEVAEAVASAKGPLRVRGGGTRGGGGAGEVLSVARLSGIALYEPGALTLVARAGTPMAEIEAALACEKQCLPFEPKDHRAVLGTEGAPTIGGVVAVNASGPRRIVAGACRDSLIGLRFVDGTGMAVKSGGRVMKNVTGYDLVKLLAGSHGTLGVLTEVAFKVLPDNATAATLVVRGLDVAQAVAAMAAALGSPFGVSGAAHVPARGETCLRVEGLDASVAYRAGELRGVLVRFGSVETESDPDAVRDRWTAIRDARMFAGGAGDLWRMSVRPSDAPRLAAALGPVPLLLDWAGGLVWAETEPGRDLRPALAGLSGHATLIRAAPETCARLGRFHPEAPPLAAISRGLRARFDPRGILNPGVMDTSEMAGA